jgi:uncharacterized protein (DUF2267 family)
MRQSRLVPDPALRVALQQLADRLPLESAAALCGLTPRTLRRFLRDGKADKSWHSYVWGRTKISFPFLIDSAANELPHTEVAHGLQNKNDS